MHHSQPVTTTVNSTPTPASTGSPSEEAPPKQVALAMDRLGQAARIIADIRIGADRLLEALFIASQPHQSTKPLQLFHNEDASMRRHLQDLRSLGRQLEESGVLNESLRSRSNSWGLHMPLVCPDGAVVAYAWKRQLAGQAGASAVDRTRLALKAFTDQKRRFFPHLDDGLLNNDTPSKKHCGSEEIMLDCKDEASSLSTLPDVLKRLEKEVPNLEILTFERLDWLKRAPSLPSSQNENSVEHNFHGSNNLRPGSFGTDAADKIAVIELLFPSVFRAVVSLHPAGSIDPDAVAFFSPDEGGSYVHARGYSVHHVYRHITEYAATALQYFLGNQAETSLYCLLHWICSYQTLFTRSCSKCSLLLAMDKQSALLLPPVHRAYWQFSFSKLLSTITSKDQSTDTTQAFHVGCFSAET
ncbi:mediator of RNA polymerase II transcription subunit 27 [Neltuma alba]|uniref:mediator of RNA polymerase II transcription subunit 27 n=1 Tax=Neltuma alba TaxID=207710 RepID=UPI0010A49CB1|nr:mediator of RNA polymerase II transcription subunit 27 [Prosopis alba]XP_028777667.1 mediator of RNA polymerase II transcription subunit 27 [Prosopis alba]